MKKRIYIAYTGGTIGMQRSADGYRQMQGFAELIEQKIPPRLHGEMPDYELHEYPEQIDSSNIQPANWLQIAEDIRRNYADYDGFVVLHGTDTMAYTASSLSFLLQGIAKPVILTGSQIPLCEQRSDALGNLVTAIELACETDIKEVCLYFNGQLLRGNRSCKLKATGFDAFASPNLSALGKVGIHIELNKELLLGPSTEQAFNLPASYAGEYVLPLQVFPGIRADLIRSIASLPYKAIILSSYGVGNAPDNDKDFLLALSELNDQGRVIVNLSQCLQGAVHQGSYATGSSLAKTGIISGADMTLEAAFTKLHHLFALGHSSEEVKALMQQNLCGELSP